MTDKDLISVLESLVGQSIVDVLYIQPKFHFQNKDGFPQGDWTKINPDMFVLHSPEWKLKLSGGKTLCISGQQLTEENFASNFNISTTTKANKDDRILTVPKAFKWLDIMNKPITNFRLWQRIIKSRRILGYEYQVQYQDHFQIIELVCGDKLFSLTTMTGDLGSVTYYPTGYFGEEIGVFFNKLICSSHTVFDSIMRMKVTYYSKS